MLQEEGTSCIELSKNTSHKELKESITWKKLEKLKGWWWYAGSRPDLYSLSKTLYPNEGLRKPFGLMPSETHVLPFECSDPLT